MEKVLNTIGVSTVFSTSDIKRRRPTGSYDQIICAKCESDYQGIDNQAFEILVNSFEKNLVPFNDMRDSLALRINGKYINDLKRFILYTLWKASVSNLPEFKNLSLGKYHENQIRTLLKNNEPININYYPFFSIYTKSPHASILPRNLPKKDFEGLNFCELDLGQFLFRVKTDKRPSPRNLVDVMEHEHIVLIVFEVTPEKRFSSMKEIAIRHANFMDTLKKKN